MKNLNRRRFIATGLTGAAGMAIAPAMASVNAPPQEKNIIYRTLGKTGLKVPVVSFGVMRSDNPGLCKAAFENGITMFDTANGYQNGNNETMLGNLFKDYPRDSFIMATKVKPAGIDREGKPTAQTTVEEFLSGFETSLSRLRMSYVDILYIHDISSRELLEHKQLLNAVSRLKKEGRIKFLGFSTHRNEAMVIDLAASMNVYDVILTSFNFRHGSLRDLTASVKKAAAAGIGIVAMKTLAGGKGVNPSAAIKWVLSNPDIHTTIPGMTNFDELNVNLKILSDITMTDQEKSDVLTAGADPGLFCAGCSQCVADCPKHLPIPDLMRAYMYAYGYPSAAMARELIAELGTGDSPCSGCDVCNVKCTRNFSIREKIADISRLANVPAEFLT